MFVQKLLDFRWIDVFSSSNDQILKERNRLDQIHQWWLLGKHGNELFEATFTLILPTILMYPFSSIVAKSLGKKNRKINQAGSFILAWPNYFKGTCHERHTHWRTNRWHQCRRQFWLCPPSIPAWRCNLESISPRRYWWVKDGRYCR